MAQPELIDISEYVTGFDLGSDADITGVLFGMGKSIGPITISGRWEPNCPTVADLALKVALQGITRLPRKTKKAFKKYWQFRPTSESERARIRRSIGRE